ncbi:Aldolase-II domain-containing protein [Mycena indigotica]|uniref:Aldolase-II domain-containing protein n=1 Tax=Mycena indigotica TaxID=2126181 RepID=A0A8H6T3V4_9AGAR|nr:Aldolase-II domain-containing protein [Mycena indigotica]KAF7309417.1 Aldolase-II domain-containing protein [Mycena indigotica]
MQDEFTERLRDLSLASRILAQHGVVDGFGHISCRDPRAPDDHFLLSRNLAPALVVPEDIVVWRIIDAQPVNPDSPRGFLERSIHSEIYRQHKDVHAVVHFHSPDVIPFGVAPIPFKAIFHMASFLGSSNPPIFDIAQDFGPSTDMLIRNTTHGASLASLFLPPEQSQLTRPLVLMRGHGATLTAPSLKLAVFRAIYTQTNARILTSLSALTGGQSNIKFLSQEECQQATESISGQVGRAWDVWARELEDNGHSM